MTVTVITCRGLFEPVSNTNMLSNLVNRLDRARFRVEEFSPWAAGFGDYDVALERTAGLLAERVRREPGPVVLCGYSGGAHVVKRACLVLGGDDRRKVARVVLCADPSMPLGHVPGVIERWVGTSAYGYSGIAGSEPLWMSKSSQVVYVSDAGDPICQTPTGSPLRTLAAFLTSMGPDAGMPMRMRAKLAAAAVGRRYDLAAYPEASLLFGDYAFRGAHTRPYPSLLARVGDDINREVHG